MRLITPEEMPGDVRGVVCRQSRVVSALGTTVMLSLILGAPGFLIWQAHPPWWVMLLAATVAGLIVRWFVGIMIKSWRASNWLLRIGRDGLWINVRSYLNHELPTGKTIVFLPFDEIGYARERVVKRAEKNRGRTMAWTDKYLELALNGVSTDELCAELAAELSRRVTETHLGGLATSRSRHGHAPVTVAESSVIRIAWRGRYDWVSPSLRRTLAALRTRVRIGETTHVDLSDLQTLTREEVDELARQFVEGGDKIGAIKLLADRRGCSVTEARQLVEELTGAA
jgi:hypothetical protein